MRAKRIRLSFLAAVACAALAGALAQGAERLVVASWNVENLFDTEDDPTCEGDDGYTPRGWMRWTSARYALKLEHVAAVIAAMAPDVLCLIEVENRRVLEDLSRVLREKRGCDLPAIVHREGGDARGIDVAMLARRAPVATNWFCAVSGQRDVLACDFDFDGRGLTVLVNHWKSQLGKKEESDAIRTREAQSVRAFLDARLSASPAAAIIAAGDFNDAPAAPILSGVAGFSLEKDAVLGDPSGRLLYNLWGELPAEARATYYYAPAKQWNALDSMCVTRGLLEGRAAAPGWRVVARSFNVCKRPEQCSQSGAPLPFRRVRSKEAGDVYMTGYSDHFPIRVELEPR